MLTPHELRMLATLVTGAQERPAAPVDVHLFVSRGVEVLASEQSRLLDVVYGPNGTQQLLAKLHSQVRSSPGMCWAACQIWMLCGGLL